MRDQPVVSLVTWLRIESLDRSVAQILIYEDATPLNALESQGTMVADTMEQCLFYPLSATARCYSPKVTKG